MSGSTAQNILGTVASWLVLAACGIAVAVYPGELKRIGFWLLGTTPQAIVGGIEAAPRAPTTPAAEPRRRPSAGTVALSAGANGHFHTTAAMNGRDIDVMVDTGASIVALTYEDAERAGIYVQPADFTHRVSTANGYARVAPIKIESISIGDVTVRDVQGTVSEPGRLRTTLLGMSFLGRLSRTEMRNGTLILEQ